MDSGEEPDTREGRSGAGCGPARTDFDRARALALLRAGTGDPRAEFRDGQDAAIEHLVAARIERNEVDILLISPECLASEEFRMGP
ncbi:MAG: hypothetical protein HZB39_03955 [Planctomycetes bacterium]|nr:hypothetical protein [Planctomycetota bacterium]